jgi:hypothetical protein
MGSKDACIYVALSWEYPRSLAMSHLLLHHADVMLPINQSMAPTPQKEVCTDMGRYQCIRFVLGHMTRKLNGAHSHVGKKPQIHLQVPQSADCVRYISVVETTCTFANLPAMLSRELISYEEDQNK